MRPTPTYACHRTPESLEPCGETGRPAWQRAERLTAFHLAGGEGALASGRYLRAALLWDDEALYAAWESAPSLVPVTRAERDADLWTECAVELFLAAGEGYYEIEVNPRGAVLDLHFPSEDEDDWLKHRSWDAQGMAWAVSPESEDGLQPWAAELRLPWSAVPEVSRAEADGQVALRAQICRSQADLEGGFELSAWGPVVSAFCERQAMGVVVLQP